MRLEHHSLNNQIQLYASSGSPLDPEFQQFLNTSFSSLVIDPHPRLKLIKRNRNREIFYFKTQNGSYYIKRFYAASTAEKIKAGLLNKAVNSLKIANQLCRSGFHPAEPVLALTSYRTSESIYISKKLPGISFEEFLNRDIPIIGKEQGISYLLSTFARFYKDGYIHCDPKPSNFIIHETTSGYKIGLIDLESIYRLPRPINIFTYKGIAKLYLFIYKALKQPYLQDFQQTGQWQSYLKDFLEIYNPKLNPDHVRRWIDRLTSNRLKFDSALPFYHH